MTIERLGTCVIIALPARVLSVRAEQSIRANLIISLSLVDDPRTCFCQRLIQPAGGGHDGSGGDPQLKFINNWNVVECEVMNTNYSFHG